MSELILRKYQSDILDAVRRSFATGHRRPLVVLSPGGGKTVMFASMAQSSQAKGKTIWFCVHRIELLEQTVETFDRYGIPCNTIHIGMIMTMANHPERYPQPDFIIFDEAHFSMAATWRKITDRFPDAYLVGLTGSPARLDGRPLGAIYDDMVMGITTQELIDQSYLAPYRYFAPAVTDLSSLKRHGSDFDMDQATAMLSERAVFGDVIKHWREYADGLQTICYCSSIKHSTAMAEEFQAAGINAVHFDGTTPDAERRDIVKRFRHGEIKILCNVDLVSCGFDVPDCWCCVLLRPTMSVALFIQQSMRALRPQPNKTAIILDHVNNYQRHGLPDDDREWSLTSTIKPRKEYGEDGLLKIRQCPKCYHTYKSGPPVCPNCGYKTEMTREEIKNVRDIKLAEIKQRRIETARENVTDSTELDECRTLAEIQAYAKRRGYKNGWAWHVWKSRRMKGQPI